MIENKNFSASFTPTQYKAPCDVIMLHVEIIPEYKENKLDEYIVAHYELGKYHVDGGGLRLLKMLKSILSTWPVEEIEHISGVDVTKPVIQVWLSARSPDSTVATGGASTVSWERQTYRRNYCKHAT
ncbi:hypothetical protein [Candidatus Midichloria mitochondrii]|nr:hypothetical protein [Candidatus Midichloria mitochondrii]MDJ1256842.1 hypothetical protein [Candidatus Midichloria mitochondrii]